LALVLLWSVPVLEQAYRLACAYGIAAMDSIHLAFAVEAEANKFVTAEKPSKPLFRYNASKRRLRVVSIRGSQARSRPIAARYPRNSYTLLSDLQGFYVCAKSVRAKSAQG